MIKRIIDFNKGLLNIEQKENPTNLTYGEASWLLTALNEEITELNDALKSDDVVTQVDSIIDLIYFAIGGLYRIGLNEQQIEGCFKAIHEANMGKVKGKKKGREEFGDTADASKPNDWVAPEERIKCLLNI